MKIYIVAMTEHARRYRVVEVMAESESQAEDIAADIYEGDGADGWDEGELTKLTTKVIDTIERED